MESFEPKKMALIRIWQILKQYSDYNHPLTQEEISKHLESDFGIVIERKAISRNISLLREAGADIDFRRAGSYLGSRDFEDAELHMLIDGVLCSKYITAKHSADLINRLCGLSNKYFRAHVKNIYSVNDWSKTDNQALFYNIELIDEAIEKNLQVCYDYNKYGIDKKLHKSSYHHVSPYQLLLHNQRYYLMAYSEFWHHMVFHRLDRITNMRLSDKCATPLRSVCGYEQGIDYRELASAMPYMFTDKPQRIVFAADPVITDQIIDWFGKDIQISQQGDGENRLTVTVKSSPNAMEHWAMQYINFVEIILPAALREAIKKNLKNAIK